MKKMAKRKLRGADDIYTLAEKFGFTIGPAMTPEEVRVEAEKEKSRLIASAAMVNKAPAQCPETDKYYQAGLMVRRMADGLIEFFKPGFLVIVGLLVIAFVIEYMVLTLVVLAAAPWAGVILMIAGGLVIKAVFR